MTTCNYCVARALLGRHDKACPARPTAEETREGFLDGARLDVTDLASWRVGYDAAAMGRSNPNDNDPGRRLGWAMRVTRDTPPALQPALFLSLRALLERLRGMDLRTDSFAIQLASSLLFLDGDMRLAEVVVRSWPDFPRLREASQDEEKRARAQQILATSTDEAARREASVVLHGEPDDDVRTRVKGLIRSADATGRLRWRGDREIDAAEVDAFLERSGYVAPA